MEHNISSSSAYRKLRTNIEYNENLRIFIVYV